MLLTYLCTNNHGVITLPQAFLHQQGLVERYSRADKLSTIKHSLLDQNPNLIIKLKLFCCGPCNRAYHRLPKGAYDRTLRVKLDFVDFLLWIILKFSYNSHVGQLIMSYRHLDAHDLFCRNLPHTMATHVSSVILWNHCLICGFLNFARKQQALIKFL